MDDREPHRALENRSVGLLKAYGRATSDAKRLEHRRGSPRKLGASVDQNLTKQPSVRFPLRRLELDIRAQNAHVVGHETSGCPHHYTNALTERQLTWLRRELARSTAKWKIIYGHHPVYEQTDYTVERQRQLLLPILKEYRVAVYLAGHHHTMQHWQVDGIDYVVSGAGGASNYDLGDTTRANPARKFVASRPGFADVEVSEGSLTLRFVGIGPAAAVAAAGSEGRRGSGAPVVLYEYVRRR